MRIRLSAGVLAVLMAGFMCATAWAQPGPATSFAETAQATADQYTNPTNQGGVQDVTTCTVVVENGQLVRVCTTTDSNGNVVKVTRTVLGPAGTSNTFAAARGLPFTGLDLTVVMLLGASLVTVGVVIRVNSRSRRRRRPAA